VSARALGALVLCALLSGCESEKWIDALDRAPESAADSRPESERVALDSDAGPTPGKDADLSPAYLRLEDREANARKAAEITSSATISMNDAVRLAELNSKDLVASYEAIVAAHGQVIQASVYPNPSFTFGSGPISPRGFVSQAEGGLTHAVPTISQAGYTLTQPVVTGLRLVWAKREAVAQEWAARATWQVLHRANVQAVEVSYVNIVFAKENLGLQEDLLKYARDLDGISERQLNAGVITATDRAAAAVALAQQRAATEMARQAVTSAEAALAGLTGGITVPATKIAAKLGDALDVGTVESLENIMLHGHPLVRASEYALSAAKADTHLQRAVVWPDVGLSFGYTHDAIDSPPDKGYDTINFGISLTLPIWDHNQGQIVTSDANYRAAEANLTFTKDGLSSGLRASYANMIAQKKQADELKKNVIPLAEKALQLATKSFETGSSRIIDVLNARQNLANAQASLLAALQSLDQAIAGIENLTGEKLLRLE
jgi:cobalt-zinc-cadmium efflux system outer membrane protein